MRLRAIALLAILPFSIPAFAADAHGVLDVARQAVRKADYRASGHLVRVEPSGVRTSYPIAFKAHWFPGVLRVLVEVAPPSGSGAKRAQAVHALLEMRPGGQNSIRIAHPGDTAPVVLPVERWTDGLAGSGFGYEDFFEEQLFWSGQSVTEHVKYGARDCDLVKSSPGPGDNTNYAEVRAWLDRDSSFPVYEEKSVKGSGLVKEYSYFGLRREGGVWSASQIEEKNHGQGGSTLLIIDRGSTKANLGPADFTADRLIHF
jgi:hypothetical protein